MLRIVHVFTIRANKPGESDVTAEKQLYSSQYLETALDLTFIIRAVKTRSNPAFIWRHELRAGVA